MQPLAYHSVSLASFISRSALFISLFVLPLSALYAQKGNKSASALPRVEIPNTQLRKITSSIVGQEYDLYIHLPGSYGKGNKTYPVVYLLDAQWDFPLLSAIYGEQYYDGFIPEVIIVGITWGGKNPNPDMLRGRDFTPTTIAAMPHSGHAPKFLSFIKTELIPFVEANYPVSRNDRTLVGSSLGGLFTLYALFNETEVFNRYVLTSPATWWDNEIIYSYAEKKNKLPARLYMAMGELEQGKPVFDKLVSHFKTRNYEGLELQTMILTGIGHSGTKAEGYTRGLQAVFARPALTLLPNVLNKYVGTYQTSEGTKIAIAKENDHLSLVFPDNSRQLLYAETDKDFYVKGQFLLIHFTHDEDNMAGLQVESFSGSEFLKKVN